MKWQIALFATTVPLLIPTGLCQDKSERLNKTDLLDCNSRSYSNSQPVRISTPKPLGKVDVITALTGTMSPTHSTTLTINGRPVKVINARPVSAAEGCILPEDWENTNASINQQDRQ
jgi:hypothetical protein